MVNAERNPRCSASRRRMREHAGVERGHPHVPRDRADERGDVLLHLARGLVGEGDREDLEGRDLALHHQIRDPAGEDALSCPTRRRRPPAAARRGRSPPRAGPGSGRQEIVVGAPVALTFAAAYRCSVQSGMPIRQGSEPPTVHRDGAPGSPTLPRWRGREALRRRGDRRGDRHGARDPRRGSRPPSASLVCRLRPGRSATASPPRPSTMRPSTSPPRLRVPRTTPCRSSAASICPRSLASKSR